MPEEPCEVETLQHGFEAEAGGTIPSSTVTVGRPAATQCWVEQAGGTGLVIMEFQYRMRGTKKEREGRGHATMKALDVRAFQGLAVPV